MKNLRQPRHPLLASFKAMAKQPAEKWWDLEQSTRLDFCAQYLLLPMLKKGQNPTPDMLTQIMPSAVDIERQASMLLQEKPTLFKTIHAMIEQTAALFLLAGSEFEGSSET